MYDVPTCIPYEVLTDSILGSKQAREAVVTFFYYQTDGPLRQVHVW